MYFRHRNGKLRRVLVKLTLSGSRMSHRTKIGKQTSGEPIYLHYYLMDKQMWFFFCGLKPGFHIVVSVVSVVRKKIHRTDRIHSISYNKLDLSFMLY